MLVTGRGRSAAFTLIELLVVIGIIAVLSALALPIFGRVTRQGHLTATVSNMRQLNVSFISYAQDNNYQLPGRVETADPGAGKIKWIRLLLPYYQDVRLLVCPIDPANGQNYKVIDPQKLISDTSNQTAFISNGYNDLGAHDDSSVTPRLNSFEEAMNTALVGIQYPQAGNFYMDSADHDQDKILNRTAFGDRSPYGFADGSVRVLEYLGSADMSQRPPNSSVYTDWLWQVNKSIAMHRG